MFRNYDFKRISLKIFGFGIAEVLDLKPRPHLPSAKSWNWNCSGFPSPPLQCQYLCCSLSKFALCLSFQVCTSFSCLWTLLCLFLIMVSP